MLRAVKPLTGRRAHNSRSRPTRASCSGANLTREAGARPIRGATRGRGGIRDEYRRDLERCWFATLGDQRLATIKPPDRGSHDAQGPG